MITLPENIQAARLALVDKRPYLASIIWALIPVERDSKSGLETMAVDKWGRWYINVEEVKKWPLHKIVLGIIHEVNHLLRRHMDRMHTFGEWIGPGGVSLPNMAGDLEINDDLKEEIKDFKGATLPTDWLYPSQFNLPEQLLAEEYAEKLLKQAQKDGRCFHMPMPGQSQGGKGGQKGQPQQQQGQGGSGGGQKGQQGKNDQGGSGDGPGEKDKLGHGNCGSCAGGKQAPWEDGPPPGQGNGKETSKTPGLSPAEIDVLRRQVAQQIKERSNSRGTIPGGWKRWAEAELQPPKVPWTRELAAVIRRNQAEVMGAVDYTWKKLSRRSTDEILLPGLRRPKVEVITVIDTSGSMGDADLAKCLTEFAGVLKVVGLDGARFISVDAAAHISKKVFKTSQVTLAGGGGTDMRVGIDTALDMKPKPDVVIVLTDGYTPWPEHAPADGTKVIAVLTQKSEKPPDWIRTLYVND